MLMMTQELGTPESRPALKTTADSQVWGQPGLNTELQASLNPTGFILKERKKKLIKEGIVQRNMSSHIVSAETYSKKLNNREQSITCNG